MTQQTQISSRHLLPVHGLGEAAHARKLRVSIAVAAEWASHAAGQHLLVCLINLLCRQTDLVAEIEVVCDEHPLLVTCPGVPNQDSLLATLDALVDWAVGEEVRIRHRSALSSTEVTMAIGCPDQFPSDLPVDSLFAIGSGWRAWVGIADKAPRSIVPTNEDPMGSLLAASIVAGEVFKRARQAVRGAHIRAGCYSLWSRTSSEAWHDLSDGPSLRGRTLPPLHVFGVGAVGHALIYTLMAAQLNAPYFVLIDDDTYDKTNLNRCLLAGLRDVDHAKVFAVSDHVKRHGGGAAAFPCTLQNYVVADKPELRDDVAAAVKNYQFGLVASCVDKNTSRQSIQGLWPSLIVGASTVGLTARSDVYNINEQTACLACHNPTEPDGEKIRALQAKLRGMSPGGRRDFLLAHGLPAEAIEAYLNAPACGKVGESELRAFALQGSPQFSVGFVSMMAGVLQACALLKLSVFDQPDEYTSPMTAFSFWNGRLLPRKLGIDPRCQMRCETHRSKGSSAAFGCDPAGTNEDAAAAPASDCGHSRNDS